MCKRWILFLFDYLCCWLIFFFYSGGCLFRMDIERFWIWYVVGFVVLFCNVVVEDGVGVVGVDCVGDYVLYWRFVCLIEILRVENCECKLRSWKLV